MKKLWKRYEVQELFQKPFLDLMFQAQKIHRKHFDPNEIQISTLLSIKTGLCPEDCKYCAQSSRYKTKITNEPLLDMSKILDAAKKAKKIGSNRFCMGAAWRNPKERDMPYLIKIIKKIKDMGMETCMTLGSINISQAKKLSQAGLDFYNHNLDTSPTFYKKIVTTRTYQERLNTLDIIRKSGIKICSGGILGLGEKIDDRIDLLMQLSNLDQPPESIPMNMLVRIPGTPLEKNKNINDVDFIKTIAVTRIMMNKSYIRLSAGRENMSENMQTLCFMAGANSIFYGCKLLTTGNPKEVDDVRLFKKLGLHAKKFFIHHTEKNDIYNNKKYYNAMK
ncbi:biotin synthase BioB [Buchnera aphidicola]|uniref:Biotin synthase n=1 Tax=Buchnera aphidicola (Sarucallis kahawaluokalani) TaxID=1241878 RepID=A0A4D6YCY2_9GAMM|nr:biotin synthase BioB [Buchnera aphidicola (Sarucallis kahawaluokalani)]